MAGDLETRQAHIASVVSNKLQERKQVRWADADEAELEDDDLCVEQEDAEDASPTAGGRRRRRRRHRRGAAKQESLLACSNDDCSSPGGAAEAARRKNVVTWSDLGGDLIMSSSISGGSGTSPHGASDTVGFVRCGEPSKELVATAAWPPGHTTPGGAAAILPGAAVGFLGMAATSPHRADASERAPCGPSSPCRGAMVQLSAPAPAARCCAGVRADLDWTANNALEWRRWLCGSLPGVGGALHASPTELAELLQGLSQEAYED